jgi:hypothetical protein
VVEGDSRHRLNPDRGGFITEPPRFSFHFRNVRNKTFSAGSPGINSLHQGTAGLGKQMFAFVNLISLAVV